MALGCNIVERTRTMYSTSCHRQLAGKWSRSMGKGFATFCGLWVLGVVAEEPVCKSGDTFQKHSLLAYTASMHESTINQTNTGVSTKIYLVFHSQRTFLTHYNKTRQLLTAILHAYITFRSYSKISKHTVGGLLIEPLEAILSES